MEKAIRILQGAILVLLVWAAVSIAPHFRPAHAQPTAIGPANPILCNNAAAFTGTGALAQIQAGVAGRIIAICGWSATASAAGTFQVATGTGANCGTNTVNLTPVLNINTSALTDHSPTAVLSVPAGNALCVNSTVTTSSGIVWLAQF